MLQSISMWPAGHLFKFLLEDLKIAFLVVLWFLAHLKDLARRERSALLCGNPWANSVRSLPWRAAIPGGRLVLPCAGDGAELGRDFFFP